MTEDVVNDGGGVIRTADDAIKSGKKKKGRRRRKPRKRPQIETPYGKGVILTKRKRSGVETKTVKLDFGVLYMVSPIKRPEMETPYGKGEVIRKRKAKGGFNMLTVQLPFGVCHLPDPLDSKAKKVEESAPPPVNEKKSKRKRKKKGKKEAEPEPAPEPSKKKKGKKNKSKKAEPEMKTPEKKTKKGKKGKAPKDPAKEIPQTSEKPIDVNFLKNYLQKNQQQRDKELALLQRLIGK